MHRLTTCKSHCWPWAKPASWEGAAGVLSVTSVWTGAVLSLCSRFSSPSAVFSLRYFALNIIKGSLLLRVAPLWMGSAVSLVYFGYSGCTPLYYGSPRLVYVLFLDSLRVSTRRGAEAKCDPQMSTIPPVPPEPLREAAPVLPAVPPRRPRDAGQKWPSGVWRVADAVPGWAIFGSSPMLFIAITAGQALQSLVCLSYYNQSRGVRFSDVSAWATSIYLFGGSRSIKRNHSALLSPVSCITFGRNESTMVSLYVIYCLKKGMWSEWERCWLQLLPDWRGMYFLWCRTIV